MKDFSRQKNLPIIKLRIFERHHKQRLKSTFGIIVKLLIKINFELLEEWVLLCWMKNGALDVLFDYKRYTKCWIWINTVVVISVH